MNVVVIKIEHEYSEDVQPILGCRVRTDVPDRDGNFEFGCGLPWPQEGKTLYEAAQALRYMAACIESMTIKPRPVLTVVK